MFQIESIIFVIRRLHDHMETPYISYLVKENVLPRIRRDKVPKNIVLETKDQYVSFCRYFLNTQIFQFERNNYTLISLDMEEDCVCLVETKEGKESFKKGYKFSLTREMMDFDMELLVQRDLMFLLDDNGVPKETPCLLHLIQNEEAEDLDCLPPTRQVDGYFHFIADKTRGKPYVVFLKHYGTKQDQKDEYDTYFDETGKIFVKNRSQISLFF